GLKALGGDMVSHSIVVLEHCLISPYTSPNSPNKLYQYPVWLGVEARVDYGIGSPIGCENLHVLKGDCWISSMGLIDYEEIEY
ncbi:hypothetical protein L195_g051461, partial [Trifolium pratense]